jgi:hypothetical protein
MKALCSYEPATPAPSKWYSPLARHATDYGRHSRLAHGTLVSR